jgi:NADPH-dependent 2,4-dienoyl-CoA reductase/sulfur reductase-like enzyme
VRPGYERILVVGAGRAGVAAAQELRRAGFAGTLTVLSDDPDAPYDRTACSKGILTGQSRPQDVSLPVPDGLDLTWRLGRRAVHLDPGARAVLTDTDEVYPYDGLVIATGSYPATPPGWPHRAPGLHQLHSLADAWGLRADLRRARRVAVIGAGLTGCEVASAVRGLARECVLIDPKPVVMARALGDVVAGEVTRHIEREGVMLRLGRWVCGITRWRSAWLLELDGGETLVADVVVTTVGERPDTDWLAGSGLDSADGVRCDASLRVLGADHVVAAGAVAHWPNLGDPARFGQWIAALEQGRAAARTLLAGTAPAVTIVPRLWSDQFGLRIQACGQLPADAELIDVTELRRGRRTARGGLVASYRAAGRLVGVVAVNAPHVFTPLARTVLDTARGATPRRPPLSSEPHVRRRPVSGPALDPVGIIEE